MNCAAGGHACLVLHLEAHKVNDNSSPPGGMNASGIHSTPTFCPVNNGSYPSGIANMCCTYASRDILGRALGSVRRAKGVDQDGIGEPGRGLSMNVFDCRLSGYALVLSPPAEVVYRQQRPPGKVMVDRPRGVAPRGGLRSREAGALFHRLSLPCLQWTSSMQA